MKNIFISVIILMTCFASVYGQSVKIYMKDGARNEYNVADIDSLVFYEYEVPGASTDPNMEQFFEIMINNSLETVEENMLRFITSQLALETVPLRLAEGKQMLDFSDYLDNAWNNGFEVIEGCYGLINSINRIHSMQSERKFDKYITELRTIKAFTYYNIAQLWHNIPLPLGDDAKYSDYPQEDIQDALYYIEKELKSCIESADDENPILFNNDFRYMLLAEVYLYQKKYPAAADAISKIKDPNILISFNLSRYFWVIDNHYLQLGYDNNFVIYNPKKFELMTKECQQQTENLVNDWKELGIGYGYWAALKRLDAAKDEVLCDVYDYLMPIPDSEIRRNPNIIQNPGY